MTYKPTDIADEGTIVLRSSNIRNGKIDLTDLVRVKTIIRENQFVEQNDIVICARNGSKALVGKCAIFNLAMSESVSFGAFMAILRTAFYDYVYYFLNTQLFRNILNSDDSKQINQLTQDMLKNTLIPFPPQNEQRKIVTALNEIMHQISSIDNNANAVEHTKEVLKSRILELAIQGKLVPQDENDEPAGVLLERIRAERKAKLGKKYVESYIFKGDDNCYYEHINGKDIDITEEVPFNLPFGWEFVRLGDIITVSSGKNITSSEMSKTEQIYPVYGGNGITGYYNNYNVDINTIVIGRVGFYCGSIHITQCKSWVTDNALVVNYDDECILLKYMKHLLKWADFGKMSSSTAQPLVTGKIIKPFIIGVPPLAEQKRIVEKIDEIFVKL